MNNHKRDQETRHRLSVTVDLPGVLVLLLVGVFGMILATVGYGFFTGTLKPELVLAAGSTLFTGLLAGALTARRVAHSEPRAETETKTPDGGGGSP